MAVPYNAQSNLDLNVKMEETEKAYVIKLDKNQPSLKTNQLLLL